MAISHDDIHSIINESAAAYGADPAVEDEMAHLESGYRNVVNDWDSNAKKGTPSAGILQFIEPTFKSYSASARKLNPQAWVGVSNDWRDPRAQALTTAWAITHNKGSAWATYDRALKAKGAHANSPAPAPTRGLMAQPVTPATSSVARLLRSSDDAHDQWFANFLDGAAARRAQPTAPAASPAYAVPQGRGLGRGLGSDYRGIEAWADQLTGHHIPHTKEQETQGGHAKHSLHYEGKAVDFGDATTTPSDFNEIAAYARQHPSEFKELYFNKLDFGIKNGRIIKGLKVDGHDDHMHIATY